MRNFSLQDRDGFVVNKILQRVNLYISFRRRTLYISFDETATVQSIEINFSSRLTVLCLPEQR